MIDTRTLRAVLGGAAMVALLVHAAHATEITPAAKALAADAQKEGELVVSWSSSTLGGAKGASAFQDGINKLFGINIKISWAPGESMPNVGNQVATTQQNGLPSPTDVYIGFSRNMAVLNKQGLFQTGDYKAYSPDRMTDAVVERDMFVKFYTSTVGFSYNKNVVKSAPERFSDLLKPEFKNKIGTTPFAANFDMIAAKEAFGAEKAIAYARDFSKQVAGFMLCNETDRVATGEFPVFATDCGPGLMLQAAQKGAPIVRVMAPDVPVVSYFYLAVPKNATYPNAAKLFLTYALSPRGQEDEYSISLSDLHLFPETHAAKEMKAAEQKYGVHFTSADVAWQEGSNDDGNAAQQEIMKILQEGRRR
jgi:putative spermidine/putrescine transport system substrate-binding protein